MSNLTDRIPSLDGLRALSVGLVVFSHFSDSFGLPIHSVGNLGVRFFFVISGFLITSLLAGEIETTGTLDLKRFYFRRTLRIFPAYYFYIFIIFISTLIGLYGIPFYSFVTAVFYTSNYITPGAWELGHSWSLSVEEQFYLLFPGLILICGLARTKKSLFIIILIAPLIRAFNFGLFETIGSHEAYLLFMFSFHTNIDALASGCLLALCRNSFHRNKIYKEFLNSRAIFIFFAVIVYLTLDFSPGYIYYCLGFTALNVSIALIIDWLIENPHGMIGKILNLPALAFIGTLSYSIYLWQQPFTKYDEEKIWTHFPLNLILIILFSLFSYYFIERKFLRWRQVWEKKLKDGNAGMKTSAAVSN